MRVEILEYLNLLKEDEFHSLNNILIPYYQGMIPHFPKVRLAHMVENDLIEIKDNTHFLLGTPINDHSTEIHDLDNSKIEAKITQEGRHYLSKKLF